MIKLEQKGPTYIYNALLFFSFFFTYKTSNEYADSDWWGKKKKRRKGMIKNATRLLRPTKENARRMEREDFLNRYEKFDLEKNAVERMKR